MSPWTLHVHWRIEPHAFQRLPSDLIPHVCVRMEAVTLDPQLPLIGCTHCAWKHSPEAKTCPRCGLVVKSPCATPLSTKQKIKSLGLVMLLAAVGGPMLLEIPLGVLFGAGLGASGLLLTLFGGDTH